MIPFGRQFEVWAHSAVLIPNVNPGVTTEIVLKTVTLPALGPNGIIRTWLTWTVTNSANNKTLRVRLGGAAGTIHYALVLTASASAQSVSIIQNRNDVSSQISYVANSSGISNSPGVNVTGAIDTSTPQDLVISAQLATGIETASLEACVVELLRG